MSVPLIEQGRSVGNSDSTVQATTTSTPTRPNGSTGPSVTLSFSDGSEIVLGVDDLQVYLVAIQTLLLLYVTYREVTA